MTLFIIFGNTTLQNTKLIEILTIVWIYFYNFTSFISSICHTNFINISCLIQTIINQSSPGLRLHQFILATCNLIQNTLNYNFSGYQITSSYSSSIYNNCSSVGLQILTNYSYPIQQVQNSNAYLYETTFTPFNVIHKTQNISTVQYQTTTFPLDSIQHTLYNSFSGYKISFNLYNPHYNDINFKSLVFQIMPTYLDAIHYIWKCNPSKYQITFITPTIINSNRVECRKKLTSLDLINNYNYIIQGTSNYNTSYQIMTGLSQTVSDFKSRGWDLTTNSSDLINNVLNSSGRQTPFILPNNSGCSTVSNSF